jgi:subfamily B ATP-binding cassette protein MsbA
MTWVSLKVLHDLRVKIFSHILSQSFDFFNKSKQGSLISRVSNDTRSAQLAITAVTDDIVTQPLTVICVTVSMLYTDWRFTLYSLCVFPLCVLPISIFGRRVREIGRQDETCNAELMVFLHEALAGIRLVKSLCREPFEIKRFTEASQHMIDVGFKVRKAMAIVGPMIEAVSGIGVMAALVYVYYTHMEGSKFIMLVGSLFLLYNPVKKLSKVHVSIQKALGATTKIFELLDVDPSIKDAPGAEALARSRGEIEFNQVTFAYNVSRPPALRRVSLHIQPGKSYALVGASGAGKSTMFSMLLRFYDPDSGGIRLDGRDIRSITQRSLRMNIGMVSQDTFLFHETILDNIRYGRLDATDEEVYEAARQAYAHEFILDQPQGYQTIIGDKGCLISGGQQQRLAIARALLKDAPILLLDEATSALDSESEHEIQAALERLSTGRTVIAIAHRLSTILKSDQIVVMHQGEIKEIGRHDELLEKSGLYRRLYDLQFNQHDSAPAAEIPFEVLGPTALAS